MRKDRIFHFLVIFFIFQIFIIFNIQFAIAAEGDAILPSSIFSKEHVSLQVVSGFITSPTFLAAETIDMDYWQTNFRIGWMSGELKMADSWMRGRFQTLIEGTLSAVSEGPGDYMVGTTALIRYNFFQPGWKVIPYFQVGVGAVYNDIYRDRTQNAIGQAIEFTPQGSVGLRYLINKHWSLDAEAIFHHVSNAGLDDRNGGINASGGFVGLTHYFYTLFE